MYIVTIDELFLSELLTDRPGALCAVNGHVVSSRGTDGRQSHEGRQSSRRSASESSASEPCRSLSNRLSHSPSSDDKVRCKIPST